MWGAFLMYEYTDILFHKRSSLLLTTCLLNLFSYLTIVICPAGRGAPHNATLQYSTLT